MDDILSGNLPADHPAVKELQSRVERAIKGIGSLSLFQSLVFMAMVRRATPETRRHLDEASKECSTDGLTQSQTSLLLAHRGSFSVVLAGTMLLGTWLGVLLVLSQFPSVLIERFQNRDRPIENDGSTQTTARLLSANTDIHDESTIPHQIFKAGHSLSEATDSATNNSKLGRRALEFADEWSGNTRELMPL